MNRRATWDGETGRWHHQINLQACVQAPAEQIRLAACVMLLGCVLGALYYLNLKSFSTSATVGSPSLLPLKCEVPPKFHLSFEMPSCEFNGKLDATWEWIITNDNFFHLESMSFQKQLKMVIFVPFSMWKAFMRCIYQALKYMQVLGQERRSNHIERIDVERNSNNCLCVSLNFQPERG